MKRTILFLPLLIFIQPLFSYEKINMKVSSLYVEKTGPRTYRIETSIQQRGLTRELFEDTRIIIPVEDKIITGNFSDNRINERNFLYAGINLDMNNDGDIDDSFSIYEKSGRLYIDKQEREQLLLPKLYRGLQGVSYYDRRKQPKVYKIGENGNTFTIYKVNIKDKSIITGIGSKTRPVKFLEFPNPCIQIFVFKTVNNLSVKPSYSIAGLKNHISYTNESIFNDQGGEWLSAVWAVKEFDIEKAPPKKQIFTITGINPPFAVVINGNLSLEKGLRIRTQPVGKIVK
jgi:hypothetical protein